MYTYINFNTIFTTIWSINRINQILKTLYISFSNTAYEWTLCHTNDNLIYDNLHLQKLATKTRVWQTRLTIHFRESFATRLPLPSSRFTWKRKRNRWIECPSPHTEHSTRLYAHRGGKARPRYRCFERTPAGQSAVEQRCLSEAALFLSSSTVVARCTKLLAHPFETSRSALYPFTPRHPPPCECQWQDTQDQVTCEHLVRFVLDTIDISCIYLNVPCTLGIEIKVGSLKENRGVGRASFRRCLLGLIWICWWNWDSKWEII